MESQVSTVTTKSGVVWEYRDPGKKMVSGPYAGDDGQSLKYGFPKPKIGGFAIPKIVNYKSLSLKRRNGTDSVHSRKPYGYFGPSRLD